MSVFLVADIKVTDDAWIPDYAANVHKIVESYGGKYLSRSGNIETLEGAEKDSSVVAIIEFSDRDSAVAFANSPEYAPFGKARQAGTEGSLFIIDDTDLVGSIPYLTAG